MIFRMSLSLLFLLAGTAFGQVNLSLDNNAARQSTVPMSQTAPSNQQAF